MALGLFGKVPSRGDFLSIGLTPDALRPWEDWVAGLTGPLHHALGDDRAWDRAPALRFWIGRGPGEGMRAGIRRPSRDRVGRRFPATLLWHGAPEDGPPPPVAADDAVAAWYARLEAALDGIVRPAIALEPAAVVADLTAPPASGRPVPAKAAFFAEGTDGVAALLADVRSYDHALAAGRRSYWWSAGAEGRAAALALDGLPDGPALAALIAAVAPAGSGDPPADMPTPDPWMAASGEGALDFGASERRFDSDDESPFR